VAGLCRSLDFDSQKNFEGFSMLRRIQDRDRNSGNSRNEQKKVTVMKSTLLFAVAVAGLVGFTANVRADEAMSPRAKELASTGYRATGDDGITASPKQSRPAKRASVPRDDRAAQVSVTSADTLVTMNRAARISAALSM
jgi:hypothetical protein